MAASISQQLTPKRRIAFLTALAQCGNVRRAARSIRCSTFTVYKYRREDPAFAAAWDVALAEAMDTVLEPEAIRRAVDGVLKPVYQGGEKVGNIREYSDTLLIFLLKGGKPGKYRERLDLTGNQGGPLQIQVEGQGLANLLTAAREQADAHINGHAAPSA